MGDSITIIISIIAIVISSLAFFRGRNIDLQNQLYLKKLEANEAIMMEFFKLLNILRKNYEKLHSLDLQNLSESQKSELNELSYQIDAEIFQIQEAITIKSMFFSDELIERVLTHLQTLNGDIDRERVENEQNVLQLWESYFNEQIEKIESLINQMRLELGIKELNKKLLKRIEKGNFKFDV